MNNPQNFIDRMLEVENLTDSLVDEDAEYLLDWGVAQLRQKLGKIEDGQVAGEYTNNLMGFMRTLNQIAGDLENVQPDSLSQLAERRKKALGAGLVIVEEPFEEVAARLKTMTPRQAIEYLLRIFSKEQ